MSKEVWCFWWRVVWLHEQIKNSEKRSIAIQMGSSHLKRNKATSRWAEQTCFKVEKPATANSDLSHSTYLCVSPTPGIQDYCSNRVIEEHSASWGSRWPSQMCVTTVVHQSFVQRHWPDVCRLSLKINVCFLEHFYTCTEGTRQKPSTKSWWLSGSHHKTEETVVQAVSSAPNC